MVNKNTVALVTDMDVPLGNMIGNSLEIIEVIETLKGNGPGDLTKICRILAREMLLLSEEFDAEKIDDLIENSIRSGKALNKLIEMVEAQHGDKSYIENPDKFEKAKIIYDVIAAESKYVEQMNVEGIGAASVLLGAGREKEDSIIDYSAGIKLHKKTGDFVSKGETLASLYTSNESLIKEAEEKLLSSYIFSDESIERKPLILARVTKDGIE